MRRTRHLLARLFTLPAARRRLLLSAGLHLLVAAWQVRRWPFARIAAGLGPVQSEPAAADFAEGSSEAQALSPAQQQHVLDTAWALAQWTRRWPRPPTCLMQALAARRLLARWGTPNRLYLGVRASQAAAPAGIGAHAWLSSGGVIVTGAGEAAQHRPIAVYCAPGAAGKHAA